MNPEVHHKRTQSVNSRELVSDRILRTRPPNSKLLFKEDVQNISFYFRTKSVHTGSGDLVGKVHTVQ